MMFQVTLFKNGNLYEIVTLGAGHWLAVESGTKAGDWLVDVAWDSKATVIQFTVRRSAPVL